MFLHLDTGSMFVQSESENHKLTVAYFKMISARSSAIKVSMSFFMSISVERVK